MNPSKSTHYIPARFVTAITSSFLADNSPQSSVLGCKQWLRAGLFTEFRIRLFGVTLTICLSGVCCVAAGVIFARILPRLRVAALPVLGALDVR